MINLTEPIFLAVFILVSICITYALWQLIQTIVRLVWNHTEKPKRKNQPEAFAIPEYTETTETTDTGDDMITSSMAMAAGIAYRKGFNAGIRRPTSYSIIPEPATTAEQLAVKQYLQQFIDMSAPFQLEDQLQHRFYNPPGYEKKVYPKHADILEMMHTFDEQTALSTDVCWYTTAWNLRIAFNHLPKRFRLYNNQLYFYALPVWILQDAVPIVRGGYIVGQWYLVLANTVLGLGYDTKNGTIGTIKQEHIAKYIDIPLKVEGGLENNDRPIPDEEIKEYLYGIKDYTSRSAE